MTDLNTESVVIETKRISGSFRPERTPKFHDKRQCQDSITDDLDGVAVKKCCNAFWVWADRMMFREKQKVMPPSWWIFTIEHQMALCARCTLEELKAFRRQAQQV